MSENHKNVCRSLNYFDHFLAFVCAVIDCVSVLAFASLVGVLFCIARSTVWLNIFTITAGIKTCKSKIKKKRKTHDKMVLLTNFKLNTNEIFIPKALIDSYINHDELVSVNKC